MKDTYYIGLDAHKDINRHRLRPRRQPGEVDFTTAVLRWITAGHRSRPAQTRQETRSRNSSDLKVCYEAGPTGFVLARRLIKLGLECVVMAPTKTTRKPNEKIKTDKRDAMKIAREFRNGDIVEVRIPPSNDQAIRDVARARTDASDDLSRAKQRLKSFLLCNGHRYGPAAPPGAART